ncbi:MAG TPA: hypothetical protein PLT50_00465 [bacterium]|nr:hypothetical protein [bacterium]
MNTRQWNLYKYLKKQTDFKLQEEIAIDLGLWSGGDNFHTSRVRRLMTSDIQAINESDVIQKVIVSTSQGIKIATSEEFDKFIRAEFGQIFRKLKRARKLVKKAGLHNQKRIVFNNEREFIEAFM